MNAHIYINLNILLFASVNQSKIFIQTTELVLPTLHFYQFIIHHPDGSLLHANAKCARREKYGKSFFLVSCRALWQKTQRTLCASILINYSCAECIMCLSVSFPYFSPLCFVYSARSKQAARDLITSLRGQHRWNFNTRALASLFCLRLKRARVSFCTQGA